MGRTRPTFRQKLEAFEEDWQPYRRALRRQHQDRFDALFEMAEQFAGPASDQNPVHVYHGILFSMVLAQEVERRELEDRVAALEDVVGDAV